MMSSSSGEFRYETTTVSNATISYVDDGILTKLPAGTRIIGIFENGRSHWARLARIEVHDVDDRPRSYFLKVHQGYQGQKIVSSVYGAMTLLHKVNPRLVPQPIAWGSYTSMPDTHFFLQEFRQMSNKLPDRIIFPAMVADMHDRGEWPDGEFGYPYATYGSRHAQYFPVSDTWEECFSKGLKTVFAVELKTQGPDKELEILSETLFERIIPRLLRPLESEGRFIIPTLVHGDLWAGNIGVDEITGAPVIFDGTPLYAHHEYELGPWLCPRHELRPYIEEYTRHVAPSAPKEDFYDRLELYCLRFDMHASSLFTGNYKFREISKATMRNLVKKYGEGSIPQRQRHR